MEKTKYVIDDFKFQIYKIDFDDSKRKQVMEEKITNSIIKIFNIWCNLKHELKIGKTYKPEERIKGYPEFTKMYTLVYSKNEGPELIENLEKIFSEICKKLKISVNIDTNSAGEMKENDEYYLYLAATNSLNVE